MNKRQIKKKKRKTLQCEKEIKRNKKLIKKYPFLLPRSVWTDDIIWDYDYSFTWLDCIDVGWRSAFGELLCEELRSALLRAGQLKEFRFIEIKEKYGTLRLYDSGATQEVHDIIMKYEFISGYICNMCGKPDVEIVDCHGWYLPVCEECYNKIVKRVPEHVRIPYAKRLYEGKNIPMPMSYSVEIYRPNIGRKTIMYDISDTVFKIKERYNGNTHGNR